MIRISQKSINLIVLFVNRCDYRQKLIEFYKKYAPDKISNVDEILKKYKNHENKLFKRLYEIYNVKIEEEKLVDPELDFCSKSFNALKALNSDIDLPYPDVQILDNISKCRHLVYRNYFIF